MKQTLIIRIAERGDLPVIQSLLHAVNLLTDDVLVPGTQYWVAEQYSQHVVAVAGVEWGHTAALLRSVAVDPSVQGQGIGTQLVHHVLAAVHNAGFAIVYLFSTRSGGYWSGLGFRQVPVDEVAQALPAVPQVQRFGTIGKLARETAWRKNLQEFSKTDEGKRA